MVSKVASRREKETTTTEGNILACDKSKRKIVDNTDVEQRCKFRVDPLVEKAYLEIKAKR